MTNYIVDCRYGYSTTPLGQPDFTIQVEATSPEEAVLVAGDRKDEFFYIVQVREPLDLIRELRSHVSLLAQFGYEMARKSRDADNNVSEFKDSAAAIGIAAGVYNEHANEEDDEAGITAERRSIEAEELEAQYGRWEEHPDYPEYMWRDDNDTRLNYWPWVAERLAAVDEDWKEADGHTRALSDAEYLISGKRQREALWAFHNFDFKPYGGATLVSWNGNASECIADIILGGYEKPEHVFVVEFDGDSAEVKHVGIEPLGMVLTSFEKSLSST